MGDRSLVVRIRAELADFKRQMSGAAQDVKQVGSAAQDSSGRATAALSRISAAAEKNAGAWGNVGDAVGRASLAVGVGLGLAAKAAIDWESAWAGVAKTVDGNASQMAQLESELRGLTQVLPATHAEIAAVAEAAGQLGIARGDIAGFTKIMIDLGESTNLSADEAATSLAQISNVMGTMDREGVGGIERMGSALVALGNAGASTEADIVAMSTRIAGSANLIGASEADVLALANALSSVGVEAQLGGGVISRVLTQINTEVLSSGERLDDFARLAGVSAQAFAQAWQADPVAAFQQVVAGLARVQESGGDTATVLSDLGIKGTENASVMLRLTGASGMLADSLQTGRAAWQQNSALAEEAAKRYETAGAQIAMARNAVYDAAITLGGELAPSLTTVANLVAGVANAFGSLPEPMQRVIATTALVGSGAGLAAVGIGKLVGLGRDVRSVFSDISTSSPRAAAGMTRAGQAAAVAGKAFAAAAAAGVAMGAIIDGPQWSSGVEQLTADVLAGGDALARWNARLAEGAAYDLRMDSNIRSMGDALRYSFDPGFLGQVDKTLGSVFSAFGAQNFSDVARAKAVLGEFDATLASMVRGGNASQAAEVMRQIADEAKAQGMSVSDLADRFPQYAEALAAVSNQSKAAGESGTAAASGLDQMSGSMDESASSAQDAAAAIDDLASSYADLGAQLLGQRGSAREFQAAIDDATAAVQENGRNLNINSEAGRANQAALDGIAEATGEWAARSIEAGAAQSEVAKIVSSGRAAFIDAAVAMGMSAEKAGALATQLGLVPEEVSTSFEAAGIEGEQEKVVTYTGVVNGVPQTSITTFSTPGSGQAQDQARLTTAALGDVPKSSVTTFSTPGSTAAQWQSGLVKQGVVAIPKSWSTHLSVSGASAAAAEAWRVKASLESIPRTVWSSVIVSRISRNIPVGNEDGGILRGTPTGAVKAYAGGGIALGTGAYVPRVPQILSGTGGVLWQEPVTGWEAYISGKPGMERRNLRVWADAGRMLGIPPWVLELARVQRHFADGGMSGNGQAPAAMGGFPDAGMVAGLVAREVRSVLAGMTVQMDGDRVGRIITRHQRGMTRL